MTTTTTAGPVLRAGTYDVDPIHSSVAFAVRHLGINLVRGSFPRYSATIEVPEDLGTLGVIASIEAGAIDSGFAQRDEHLRTADFFDVENHPHITFASTSATPPAASGAFQVIGEITIRGVTQPIVLDAKLGGTSEDQYGNERLGLTATGRIRRSSFGLPFGQQVGDVPLVADTIRLALDVEAIRRG